MANHRERRELGKLEPVRSDPATQLHFAPRTRFAPSYRVDSKTGPNRCLIHDEEFVDDVDPDNAARIAHDRTIQTQIGGLFWDGKVVAVPPTGIPCVEGMAGPFRVLFISGPVFDAQKAADRQLMARVSGVSIPAARADIKIEEA